MTFSATAALPAHAAHLLILLVPATATATSVVAAAASWRSRPARPPRPRQARLRLAVGLSAGAALAHAAVYRPHLRESALYGAFFALLAAAQLAWAVLVLRRPRPGLLLTGAALNLAAVALWVLTRTVGIPLGPESGTVEPVGRLDLVTTLAEVAVGWLALTHASLRRPAGSCACPHAERHRPAECEQAA